MKVFMSLKEASEETGFSVWYLRKGCVNNTIPYIKVGRDYKVNVVAFLEQIDRESKEVIKKKGVKHNG